MVFTGSISDFWEGVCGSLTRRFDRSSTAVLVEGHVRVGMRMLTRLSIKAASDTWAAVKLVCPIPVITVTSLPLRRVQPALMDSYSTDST